MRERRASVFFSLITGGVKRRPPVSLAQGASVQDNVASVLVASLGADRALDVFGTCRLAEQPADPMLLETIDVEGCVEMRYPLAGHLHLHPVQVEL